MEVNIKLVFGVILQGEWEGSEVHLLLSHAVRPHTVKHNMKFLEMLVLLTYTTIENKQEVNNPNLKLKIICCGKISDAKGLLIHVRGQEALKVCSSSCAIVVLSSSSEHSSLNVVISTRI